MAGELWPYLLGTFTVLVLVTYVPLVSIGLPDLLTGR
jgi:TRAP-type C4-dicarboxylate transport system permease large subunit